MQRSFTKFPYLYAYIEKLCVVRASLVGPVDQVLQHVFYLRVMQALLPTAVHRYLERIVLEIFTMLLAVPL